MKSLTDLQKLRDESWTIYEKDLDYFESAKFVENVFKAGFDAAQAEYAKREEIYKELVSKMKAALKRISEEVTEPHLNLHGDLVVSPTLSSLVAYKVVLDVEKIESGLK